MVPFAVGQRLGNYELKFALGRTSFGNAFRARHASTGREVCVTVLAEQWPMNGSGRTHAICHLDHPSIARVFEISTDDSVLFAVSEWLGGETLRQKLHKGPLLALKAAEYGLQIAHALAAAHAAGVIHGDLKPESILITREGVKLLDIGFATLGLPASTNVIADYASPEQVRGEPESERTDIFSFGVVFYEMISGRRPFLRNSLLATTSAILNDDPEPFAKVSPALDRITRHCLEKAPENRFGSASELAFAIESFGGLAVTPRLARRVRRKSLTRVILTAIPVTLVGIAIGALAARQFLRPTESAPLAFRYLTASGRDSAPSASADGKSIVFASDRSGVSRIWLMDLVEGREAALTSGPDRDPRFSPDAASVLFIRREGQRDSLYTIETSGEKQHKVMDGITAADWSPNRPEIAWLRIEEKASVLGVVDPEGKHPVEVARVANQVLQHPRWSPDGALIASAAGSSEGFHQSIFVSSVDGSGRQYYLWPPPNPGSLSAPVWSEDGANIFYFQSESLAGGNGWPGGAAHIIRQNAKTGSSNIVGFSQQSAQIIDTLGPGRLIFDTSSGRENLEEIPLAGKSDARRFLTLGDNSDQDPAYSPDGKFLVFASLRAGSLDLWQIARETGASNRLIHGPSIDAEPCLTSDGARIYWSSNREGHFEIFTSSMDGAFLRRVTHDGVDAEHPSLTPDGAWVVYNSYNPDRKGIWRTAPSGIGDTQIVKGPTRWPEVSPDGRYVLYTVDTSPAARSVRVVAIDGGENGTNRVLFEIKLEIRRSRTAAAIGRARWMPGGHAIAYIGQDEDGRTGIFAQEFTPGRDGAGTRRALGGFDPQRVPQSFGLARDGSVMTISGWEQVFGIEEVDGVLGAGRRLKE